MTNIIINPFVPPTSLPVHGFPNQVGANGVRWSPFKDRRLRGHPLRSKKFIVNKARTAGSTNQLNFKLKVSLQTGDVGPQPGVFFGDHPNGEAHLWILL